MEGINPKPSTLEPRLMPLPDSSQFVSATSSENDSSSNSSNIIPLLKTMPPLSEIQANSSIPKRYQKRATLISLLPYSANEVIEKEADERFKTIKETLFKCILMRDTQIAFSTYTFHLSRYISLYNYMFSKEDHVRLIHFYYTVIFEPTNPHEGLDTICMTRACGVLNDLLKKRDLLTPADLTINWRPLYSRLKWLTRNRLHSEFSIEVFPGSLKSQLEDVVRNSRAYFPRSATREILDEFYPMVCPTDSECLWALYFLQMLLPTNVFDADTFKDTIGLWFNDIIEISRTLTNYSGEEKYVLCLLIRVAHEAIAVSDLIDFQPFLPVIFTKLLRHFGIPVGSQLICSGSSGAKLEGGWFASLIVWLLGGRNSGPVFAHLEQLADAVAGFCHPSNSGKWSPHISTFFHDLADYFVSRVQHERIRKPVWHLQVPPHRRLTDEDITRFVLILKPIEMRLLFGKGIGHSVHSTLRWLATLRPQLIIPDILSWTYGALETLTEPHRLLSCLQALSQLLRTMLTPAVTIGPASASDSPVPRGWHTDCFPSGRTHALRLLNACLPGLDFNDMMKCFLTFQVIASLGTLVPLIDCSELVAVHRRQQRLLRQRSLDSDTASAHPEALSPPAISPVSAEMLSPAGVSCASESNSDQSDDMVDLGSPAHQRRLSNGELVLDLSPEEESLCQLSRQCEDFLVQFMDRTFALLESNMANAGAQSLAGGSASNTDENRSLATEERVLESGISSAFDCVIHQCSLPLLKVALNKLYNFVTRGVYETKLAGVALAGMCRRMCKNHPTLSFFKFFDVFYRNLMTTMDSEDFKDSEDQDDALLWYLCVLSQIVCTDGQLLTERASEIERVLDRTLWLKSKRACSFARSLLASSLRTLLGIYLCEKTTIQPPYRARPPRVPRAGDAPAQSHPQYDLHSRLSWTYDIERLTSPEDGKFELDYVPIRLWGESYPQSELVVSWHVPSRAELELAQHLVRRYVPKCLDALTGLMRSERELTKEELIQNFKVLSAILQFTSISIPHLEAPVYETVKSILPWPEFKCIASCDNFSITLENGRNVRNAILEVIHPLFSYMVSKYEDKTKCMSALIQLFGNLLFITSLNSEAHSKDSTETKGLKTLKGILEHRLLGKRQHLRVITAQRSFVLHNTRVSHASQTRFNEAHYAFTLFIAIFVDLVRLAKSRYYAVQKDAQNVLAEATQQYGHTRRLLLRMASSELSRWIGEYRLVQEAAAQLRTASKSRGTVTTPAALVADTLQQLAASASASASSNGATALAPDATAATSAKARRNSDSLPSPSGHQSDSDEDDQLDTPRSALKHRKHRKNSGAEGVDSLDADKIRLEHEILGILHIVSEFTQHSDLSVSSWEIRSLIWPQLLRVTHEKSQVVQKLERVIAGVLKAGTCTSPLVLNIPERWLHVVARLTLLSPPPPSLSSWNDQSSTDIGENCSFERLQTLCSAEQIETGRRFLEQVNMKFHEDFEHLKQSLLDVCHSGDVVWKMEDLCLEMLSMLFHPQQKEMDPDVARVFLHGLIHDSVSIRNLCMDSMGAMLKVQQPRRLKVEVAIGEVLARVAPGVQASDPLTTAPGIRPDNLWLTYDGHSNVYESAQAFASASQNFVRRNHIGYYMLPMTLRILSTEDCFDINRPVDLMRMDERIVFEFFTNEQHLERLFKFLTLEDKSNHKSFANKYYLAYRGLFHNMGIRAFRALKPHIESALREKDPQRLEPSHLTASEMLAGLVRGSTRWPYGDLMEMWNWLLIQLNYILEHTTIETLGSWSNIFTTIAGDMDPKFLHPLYCLFLNNREQLKFFSPDIDSTSCTTSANGSKVESGATMETDDAQASESPSMSLATLQQNALIGGRPASIFHIASRLLMMQLFVSQGDWRIPIIWQNLSQQLEQFIDQPFKIIRERVGSFLASAYTCSIELHRESEVLSPETLELRNLYRTPPLGPFIERLLPRLEQLIESWSTEASTDAAEKSSLSKTDSPREKSSHVPPEALVRSLRGAGLTDVDLKKVLAGFALSSGQQASADLERFLQSATSLQSFSSSPSSKRSRLADGETETKDEAELEAELRALTIGGAATSEAEATKTKNLCFFKTVMKFFKRLFESAYKTPFHALQLIPALCQLHSDQAGGEPELKQVTLDALLAVAGAHLCFSEKELLDLFDVCRQVREAAKDTLSGMLRCGALPVEKSLLAELQLRERTALPATAGASVSGSTASAALIERHAGVLGLCACVEATPYSVPPHLPALLVRLASHLHDPQPIAGSVRRTLAHFKRTHADEWDTEHRAKFSEQQLSALTDALVSPNYYA